MKTTYIKRRSAQFWKDKYDEAQAELAEAVALLEWSNVFIPVDYKPEEQLNESNDANRSRQTKREIKSFLARHRKGGDA